MAAGVALAGCDDSALAPLPVAVATRVLTPYFDRLRRRFARELPLVAGTQLRVDPKMHDTPRHFAACRDDGRLILVAPHLCDQPVSTVEGILAHELGHAVDFLYPAEWVLRGRKVVRRERRDFGEAEWERFARAWQKRDADAVELTADGIAESVLGEPLGYCGPCRLQTLGAPECGRRPMGLR